MTIERDVRRNVAIHAHRLGELGIFLVSLERALAKQVTTLHATVLLSLSKWVRFACNLYFHTCAETLGVCRAERVCIESDSVEKSGNTCAPITERKRDGIVSVTWSHVGRCSYRGVPGFDFNDVGDDVEVDVVANFSATL